MELLGEWVGIAAATVTASATVVAVTIAWVQLRAARREQRLSRRPIISVEPETRTSGEKSSLTVRNIGEGPALECGVTLYLLPLDEFRRVKNLRDLESRWQQSVGTVGTRESKTFQIDGTPQKKDAWGEVLAGEELAFVWTSSCRNVFGERLKDEGRQLVEMRYLLDFDQNR
jgi:hypothetical protein